MVDLLKPFRKKPAAKSVPFTPSAPKCAKCAKTAKGLKKPQLSFYSTKVNALPVILKVGNAYCEKCAPQIECAAFITPEVWDSVQAAMLARNLTANAQETASLMWVSD